MPVIVESCAAPGNVLTPDASIICTHCKQKMCPRFKIVSGIRSQHTGQLPSWFTSGNCWTASATDKSSSRSCCASSNGLSRRSSSRLAKKFVLRRKKFASWATKNLSIPLISTYFAESSNSNCGSTGATRRALRRPLSAPRLSFIGTAGLASMASLRTVARSRIRTRAGRLWGYPLPRL